MKRDKHKNNPIVKLKNGSSAPKKIVEEVYANITTLKNIGTHDNIAALNDLYNKAQDTAYEIVKGNNLQILFAQGFIKKDGNFFAYVQEIVESSLKLEDHIPRITDPTAGNILSSHKKNSLKEIFLKPILYPKAKSEGDNKKSALDQDICGALAVPESKTLELPRTSSHEKFYIPSPLSKVRSKGFEVLTAPLGEDSDSDVGDS